jgi:multidrug efflux pump
LSDADSTSWALYRSGRLRRGALGGAGGSAHTGQGQPPGLVGLFNGFRARTPQLYADIDRTKVMTMGVALSDVFDALQAFLGSYHVNDFNRFGRTWQVNVQADKNAILIVEFARDRQLEGASRFDAAREAARVRLRPIVPPLAPRRPRATSRPAIALRTASLAESLRASSLVSGGSTGLRIASRAAWAGEGRSAL